MRISNNQMRATDGPHALVFVHYKRGARGFYMFPNPETGSWCSECHLQKDNACRSVTNNPACTTSERRDGKPGYWKEVPRADIE